MITGHINIPVQCTSHRLLPIITIIRRYIVKINIEHLFTTHKNGFLKKLDTRVPEMIKLSNTYYMNSQRTRLLLI